MFRFVYDALKCTINVIFTGIPKSTCVDQAGHYVLVGLSSGVVTLLDVRTGLSVKTWKPHDAEIVKVVKCCYLSFQHSSMSCDRYELLQTGLLLLHRMDD